MFLCSFLRRLCQRVDDWNFQAYMQAKSKGAPVVEDPTPKGISIHDRRIDIQPAEDEEDPGKFSVSGFVLTLSN